ncbi:DUF427 domain-containing protein [Pontibacter ruber]|uniref:DUF427 domain-containing protein n=1 Tax=Pontibacter ruber TaxID=1343895 RepID=A0ABW5D3Q2_9BACT|nr:DUF427 domain-containing protein [Pontibacter ruber]
MKAIWNDVVIAESDQTIKEGSSLYFPPNSVKQEYFERSETHTTDPQGEASYYHIKVNGKVKLDAARYYPNPKAEGNKVRDYVTFDESITMKD